MNHTVDFEAISCQFETLNFKGELYRPSGPGPNPAVLVVPTAF
jgi:hypothetical protein